MKTYWDHSDQERAGLSEEDVRLLLDVELMAKGVRKPVAPTLKSVPPSPLGQRKRFFGVEGKSKYGSDQTFGIVFATIEAAQSFIDLCPLREDYDYEVGTESKYAVPGQDLKIVSVDLYALEQVNEFRSSLKQRKALATENERLQSEFAKASKEAEKITDGVWENWYAQRAKSDSLRKVIETYKQYLTLTKNDVGLALTFLKKIHSSEEILEVNAWFPDNIPLEAPPECIPA